MRWLTTLQAQATPPRQRGKYMDLTEALWRPGLLLLLLLQAQLLERRHVRQPHRCKLRQSMRPLLEDRHRAF